MWNLLKSVFRSLKHNKVATIGLAFLVFLSTATFTVLNSTTTNINNEYGKIKSEGNLHDFTVSELYNNSEAKYIYNLDSEKPSPDGNRYDGKSKELATVPWPHDVENGGVVTERTWWYRLDVSSLDSTTPLYIFFQEHKDDEKFQNIFFPLISISLDSAAKFSYVTNSTDYVSTETTENIYKEINNDKDGTAKVETQLNLVKQKLYGEMSNYPSPMASYLTDLINKKDVQNYKKINSLNINNSQDKIYYKSIESNPEDVIDKVVLFNESFAGVGRNNFSINAWNPIEGISLPDQSAIDGLRMEDIASIVVPKYDDVSVTDTKTQSKIIAKFMLLSKGTCSQKPDYDVDVNFYSIVKVLTTFKWNDPEFKNSYNLWCDNWQDKEFADSNEYRITLTYNRADVPIWKIENWTSHFSVFAPSFLEKTKKEPINIENGEHPLTSYKIFNDWYEKQSSEIKNKNKWEQIKIFLNDCTDDEINGPNGFFEQFQEANPNCVVNIDNSLPMIIIGSGITPDYIYPIVSIDRPVPNTSEECIFFSNSSGYERLQTAYRANDTEIYIAGKFAPGANWANVLDKINERGQEILSWPSNIKCAYLADDITNVLNASAFRIAYIPNFVEKINTVDYFLTMFVVILAVLISLIVIRRYITNNRVNIGIIQANGISKTKVGFSLTPFSLIPAFAGGIGGYVVGTFLQVFTLGLLGAYWVVPTPILGFSWIALVTSVTIPLVLFVLASLLSTFFTLREKTVNLMKYGSEFKTNPAARFATKAFSSFNVLTKFRISIAFNSIWKLLILCLMIAMTLSTFVFGLAVDNKFDKALASTSQSRDYKYAIDLYSPTTQGGQYIPTDSDTFGQSGFQTNVGNKNETVYVPSVLSENKDWPANERIRKNYYDQSFMMKQDDKDIFFGKTKDSKGKYHGNVLMPMLADSISLTWDLQYLKNKVSTKTVMDFEMGMGAISANPWKIAKALMPDNAINQSNTRTDKLMKEVFQKASDSSEELYSYKDLFDINTGRFIEDKIIETNGGLMNSYFKVSDDSGKAIDNSFVELLWDVYEKEIFSDGQNGINNDYSINYGLVPMANDDETYTYLEVDGREKNNRIKISTPDNTKIMGIQAYKNGPTTIKSEFVKLVDKNGNDLVEKLCFNAQKNKNEFPMVVNRYVAKKYNIKVGDKVSFAIKNTANRFQKIIDKDEAEKIVTFDIVGINETFTGEEYFTNQEIANYVLGLKSNVTAVGKTELPNNYIDFSDYLDGKNISILNLSDSEFKTDEKQVVPNGFNGIFTKHSDGGRLLSNSLSLYSPSGLWPGTDKLTSPTMLDSLRVNDRNNTWLASTISGFSDTQIGKDIDDAFNKWKAADPGTPAETAAFEKMISYAKNLLPEIGRVFGQTAYVSLMANVVSATASEIVFLNMSKMINTVEQIIIIVISVMVGLVVMLITSIIISDSKKMAGLLKALGYTDRENTITFLSIYLPVVVIGLLLAIPLSMGIVSLFQTAIFYGAKILLSTTIEWWFFPAGILLVIGLMSITASLGYGAIKKEKLVDLIK